MANPLRILLGLLAGSETNDKHPSALIEMRSTEQGLKVSDMTEAQKNAIDDPIDGLVIFQTDGVRGFWFYDEPDTAWKYIGDGRFLPLTGGTLTGQLNFNYSGASSYISNNELSFSDSYGEYFYMAQGAPGEGMELYWYNSASGDYNYLRRHNIAGAFSNYLPAANGTLAVSVNGNTADSAGNITISAGGVQSVSGETINNSDPQNPIVNTPTLQQVATAGSSTTVPISVTNANGSGNVQADNIFVTNTVTGQYANLLATGLQLSTNTASRGLLLKNDNMTVSYTAQAPNLSPTGTYYLPLSDVELQPTQIGRTTYRIDQNNAATTSAQLASVLTDEVGSSGGFVRASAISNFATGAGSSTDNGIARFDGTTGAVLQNSNAQIDDNGAFITGGVTNSTYTAKKIEYDNTLNQWILYDNDSSTALNVGYENWFLCKNNTGSTIPNGSAVYIIGADTGTPTIALAKADAAATTVAIGITTESIANGATGKVTQSGLVNGVNTASLTAGAVYVSATTAGALTNTAPSSPNYRMRVGFVGAINASAGTILVTPSTAAIGNGLQGQRLTVNSSGNQIWAYPKSGMFPSSAFTYAITSPTLTKAFNVGTSGNGAFNAQARTYFFDGFISLSGLSASSGQISFGFLGTATVSGIRYTPLATKAAVPSSALSGNVTSAASTALTTNTTNTTAIMRVTGQIRVSVAGTLIPAVTGSVNSPSATTDANSWFTFEDLGPNNVTATPDVD